MRDRRKNRNPQRKSNGQLFLSPLPDLALSLQLHITQASTHPSLHEVIMAKVACALLITKSRGPWSLFVSLDLSELLTLLTLSTRSDLDFLALPWLP